ncbi:unnamed protein product [Lymnaea stagnalis]|uniref:TIR domain-containing protein n=1 Tax=Lymnaea stagnalis TaxID=6523 RepID=A0AAV2IIN5_LYMST
MMSYNSKHRDSVIKVRTALDGKNYKTWMDVSDMRGSSLEKMSEAVENAAAVLICMSPHYKESPYCKLEAEYAFMQKVPTIFLLMEAGYQPDGWLGLLLGAKIFYDFSGKYDFNLKLSEMMKEIEETCGEHIPRQTSPPAKPVKAPDVKPAQPQPVLTSEPVQQAVVVKKTTKDPLGQIIEKTMQADAAEGNKMETSNLERTVIVLDEVPETPDTNNDQPKLATVANTVKKANKTVAFMSRPATSGARSKENNPKSALVPFIAEEQRRFLSEITPIASNYHYKFLMSGKVTTDSLKIQDSVEISLDSQYCNRHGIYGCVKCGLSKVTPYAIQQSGKRRKSVR